MQDSTTIHLFLLRTILSCPKRKKTVVADILMCETCTARCIMTKNYKILLGVSKLFIHRKLGHPFVSYNI